MPTTCLSPPAAESVTAGHSTAAVPIRGVGSAAEIVSLDPGMKICRQVGEQTERQVVPALLVDGHLTGRDAAGQPGQMFQSDRTLRDLPAAAGVVGVPRGERRRQGTARMAHGEAIA